MNKKSDIPIGPDWELISRYVTDRSTSLEKESVEIRMEKDPQFSEQVKKAQKTWEISGVASIGQGADRAWFLLSRSISKQEIAQQRQTEISALKKNEFRPRSKGTLKRVWWLRAAAALIVLSGLAVAWMLFEPAGTDKQTIVTTEPQMREITAERGQRIRIQLSDGSRVVLNAESSIRFPQQFNDELRDVYLDGEAYFEVAGMETDKGERAPFTVYAGELEVAVLGTEFNVNSYRENERTEIVVAGGRVSVGGSGGKVILEKGEKTYAIRGEEPGPAVEADLNAALGWLNDRFVFQGAPLEQVVRTLNRYYDREIEIADEELFGRRIMVTFENEKLSRILEVLSASLDLVVEESDDRILLRGGGN